MKAELVWKEKMLFETQVGGHTVHMDASPPFGDGKYASPKQMLLASMTACSAMDIVGLLKKHKQNFQNFRITSDAESVATRPQVFQEALMEYFVEGDVNPDIFKESVQLSLSKYCSVSAMVSKVVPIRWKAYINSVLVGEGSAEFSI